LERAGIEVAKTSRFFSTPCFPAGAGPDYVNAAAVLHAKLSALDMLQLLHRIEAEMGRERVDRWGTRTLDLDLLGVGDQVLPDINTQTYWRDLPPQIQEQTTPDQLILPHPRLQDRAFMLVPLMDVAPDWMHPVLGLSVAQMCANLPICDIEAVIAL
jgi:2-amino-4-hydroxy-6-hydroxymethyldihydropteridine diphosphokinase